MNHAKGNILHHHTPHYHDNRSPTIDRILGDKHHIKWTHKIETIIAGIYQNVSSLCIQKSQLIVISPMRSDDIHTVPYVL